MVGGRRAFANVVQQEGQVKQLRLFQLGQDLPVALVPFRLRLLGAVQALNR